MDMAMRSFLLAGVLALVAAAALAGWWFLGRDTAPVRDDDPYALSEQDRLEGSLFDEFGQPGTDDRRGEIRITVGQGLAGTAASRSAMDETPRFAGADEPEAQPWWRTSPGQGGGPGSSVFGQGAALPRGTAEERVEADCHHRGGRAWACRCLVRVARARLNQAEFDFLSLAEEADEPAARLRRSGLDAGALPALSAALIGVHVEADRRCGAGLTP
jgi:hypothetical protein